MKLVVLATATDEAAKAEAREGTRFARLRHELGAIGVRIETALNLLGRYDYLFVMDMNGGSDLAFRAMSTVAQSGTMRTETFVAMPLEAYFQLAADVNRKGRPKGASQERG
jgi:uncharacterized protein with GYD domain